MTHEPPGGKNGSTSCTRDDAAAASVFLGGDEAFRETVQIPGAWSPAGARRDCQYCTKEENHR